MTETPILVVSDTHFGFLSESADRFQRFVGFLTSWMQAPGEQIKVEPTDKYLAAPKTIILLGDIIDLCVSRDSNTIRPFQESFKVVNSLTKVGSKIVYVAGNHDYNVRVYANKDDKPTDTLLDGVSVYPDLYPDPDTMKRKGIHFRTKKWEGEQIGEKRYLFLHGHQFDLLNSNQSILRFHSFLGFSSASAQDFWLFKWFGGLAFFLTLAIVVTASVRNWLSWVLSGLTAWLNYWPWLAGPLLLVGWLLLVPIAFLGVLWFWGRIMRRYYDRYRHPGYVRENKAKTSNPRPISEVISTLLFNWKKRNIGAEAIVFGHTHYPEMYRPKQGKIELLVNTGSWIEQANDQYKFDTFVYIDGGGSRLLQWINRPGYIVELTNERDC